jgi:hypothetical protein
LPTRQQQKKKHIFLTILNKTKITSWLNLENHKTLHLMIWRENQFSFQIHFCVLASDISTLNLIGAPYLGYYYQVNAQSRNEVKIDTTTQQTTTILSLQK